MLKNKKVLQWQKGMTLPKVAAYILQDSTDTIKVPNGWYEIKCRFNKDYTPEQNAKLNAQTWTACYKNMPIVIFTSGDYLWDSSKALMAWAASIRKPVAILRKLYHYNASGSINTDYKLGTYVAYNAVPTLGYKYDFAAQVEIPHRLVQVDDYNWELQIITVAEQPWQMDMIQRAMYRGTLPHNVEYSVVIDPAQGFGNSHFQLFTTAIKSSYDITVIHGLERYSLLETVAISNSYNELLYNLGANVDKFKAEDKFTRTTMTMFSRQKSQYDPQQPETPYICTGYGPMQSFLDEGYDESDISYGISEGLLPEDTLDMYGMPLPEDDVEDGTPWTNWNWSDNFSEDDEYEDELDTTVDIAQDTDGNELSDREIFMSRYPIPGSDRHLNHLCYDKTMEIEIPEPAKQYDLLGWIKLPTPKSAK